MLHQVMFSGNIKKGNSPIINSDDAYRVCEHARQCNYSGFTIYADGNYITLYEGDINLIEKSINYYADTRRYSKIVTMISRHVEAREFESFKLCLRHMDCSDVIGVVENCVLLTPDHLHNILPKTMPHEYKTLVKTFARVNNMNILQAVA